MKQNISTFQIASKSLRLSNYFLDSIFIIVAYFTLCFVWWFYLYAFFDETRVDNFLDSDKSDNYFTVLYLITYILYYLILENINWKTIGKYITHTQTISKQWDRATFLQILWRTLSRFIPFDALSFAFSENGWHDSISNTVVIKLEKNDRYHKLEKLSEMYEKKLITSKEFSSEKKKILDSL